MTMEVYKRREISHDKRLEIIIFKPIGKSYGEIARIMGCSKSAAFDVRKKLYKSRTVKKLPRADRPKKSKTPRQERSLMKNAPMYQI